MVVVPASTAAVAGIAIGLSKDLLQRAADVTLKERRPLVVVPRETPYTRATLQHLLTLHDAGAVVLPASPGFYSAPQSVAQLVDFVAAKVLDALEVEHDLITRWRPSGSASSSVGRRGPCRSAAAGCAARQRPRHVRRAGPGRRAERAGHP
jgi:4-hydroxy-3-polyprenylbenzoate decarboxylase